MKTMTTAVALVLFGVATASADTVRIDTVQSVMPVNYPVYQAVAQVPVAAPAPVYTPAPVLPAPVAPVPVAPAPVVVQSPVVMPPPVIAPPVVTYYAPAPLYYAPVRARTIIRPWGARTVYRYW